jgi:hypothetical protein
MAETGTKAQTGSRDANGAQDKRKRLEAVQEELRDLDMVFTPFEGLMGDWGKGEQLGRKRVETEAAKQEEEDHESFPVEKVVGSLAVDVPIQRHVAFLENTRNGSQGNGAGAVRMVNELQQRYGNGYVQRVVRRVRDGENGDAGPEAVADGLEHVIAGEKGSGEPIESGTRIQMEALFGEDFGDVNVHADARADGLARALQAKAFTTGKDVFFKEGEYDPAGTDGQRLIAHELTHVVQQGGDGASGPVQREGQPPAVSAATAETGTIQRDRKKPGKLIAERIRQHEKAIEEAKGTRRPAKAAPPKKAPPPVPAKTYSHVRPGELVEEGGRPSRVFERTFHRIVKQAEKYRARKRKSPTDYKGQWAALGKLTKGIKKWRRRSWLFGKKVRRQALAKLEAQISKEKSRLVPWVTKKHLNVSAQLEKHDGSKHREGLILEYCYARWQKDTHKSWNIKKGPPPREVFDYATALEQKEDEGLLTKVLNFVGEKVGKKKAAAWMAERRLQGKREFIPRIAYVPAEERKRYRLQFSGLEVSYAETGEKLDPDKDYIYVMTPSGEFYAAEETQETMLKFHHSSFLEGAGVAAAGHIKFQHGDILMDLESGHYQPGMQHMYNAVNALEGKVPLDKLRITPLYEVKMQIYGKVFLEGVRGLKAGKGKGNASVAQLMKRYRQAHLQMSSGSEAEEKGLDNELKDLVREVKV